jgi:hypothetical protein
VGGEGGEKGEWEVTVWDPLFEVSPFFTRFSNFIQVCVCVGGGGDWVVCVCVGVGLGMFGVWGVADRTV